MSGKPQSGVLVDRDDVDVHVAGESQQVMSNRCPQQFLETSSMAMADNDMCHVLIMRDLQETFGN
jgi:hypothetical protein